MSLRSLDIWRCVISTEISFPNTHAIREYYINLGRVYGVCLVGTNASFKNDDKYADWDVEFRKSSKETNITNRRQLNLAVKVTYHEKS